MCGCSQEVHCRFIPCVAGAYPRSWATLLPGRDAVPMGFCQPGEAVLAAWQLAHAPAGPRALRSSQRRGLTLQCEPRHPHVTHLRGPGGSTPLTGNRCWAGGGAPAATGSGAVHLLASAGSAVEWVCPGGARKLIPAGLRWAGALQACRLRRQPVLIPRAFCCPRGSVGRR